MADIAGSKATLRRQHDILDRLRSEISHASRATLERRQTVLESLEEWFSAIDVDNTLRRGFAIVTSLDGSTVIRSVGQVSPGDLLEVRLGDGTVRVEVDEQ
jgi:exodeoxyribonuclease VII large subunit